MFGSCFLFLGFLLSSLMLSTSPSEPKNQRWENLSENRPKTKPKSRKSLPNPPFFQWFFWLGLGSVQPIPKPTDVFFFICCFTLKTNNGCDPFHLTVEAMRFMNGLSRGKNRGSVVGSVKSCRKTSGNSISLQTKKNAHKKKQKRIWTFLFHWSLLKEVFLKRLLVSSCVWEVSFEVVPQIASGIDHASEIL